MTAHTCTILWFFGVDFKDVRLVKDTAGEGYECRTLDHLAPAELNTMLERGEAADPLMLWLGSKAWRELRERYPETAFQLQLVPTVLVLEPDPARTLLEQAIDAHVQQVVRAPFGAEQVFDALGRAREARNLYHDMTRMSREILMDRELLERKSDICSLLFRFFQDAGNAADASGLLRSCLRSMKENLPLESLHAVWWSGPTVFLIGSEEAGGEAWLHFLTDQVRRFRREYQKSDMVAEQGAVFRIYTGGTLSSPDTGKVIMLPLNVRERPCGALVVHLRDSFLSGRDMALALDAICRYLALALWEHFERGEIFAGAETLHSGPMDRPVSRAREDVRAM